MIEDASKSVVTLFILKQCSHFFKQSFKMFLVAFLALRMQYEIDKSAQSLSLPRFVFESGGFFSIVVSNAQFENIFIGMSTTSEFKALQDIPDMNAELCYHQNEENKIVNISDIINIVNYTGSFKGNITKSGVYRAVLYNCDHFSSKYIINVHYKNLNSLLSADVTPCFSSKIPSFVLIGIILLFWFTNWFKYFTLKNLLHMLITISMLFYLIYLIVQYFEIKHMDTSDSHTPLTEIKIILVCISQITLFSILLMAAKGWSIVADTLNIFHIVISILISAASIIPLTIINNLYLDNYEIPVTIIAAFFMAVYIRELVSGVNKASLKIYAHLLVIARSGIDATTTPIFYKSKIYKSLSISLISYFILTALMMIFSDIFYIPFWISELINDLLNIAVIATVMWFFRLHNPQSDNYMMIPSSKDSLEPVEISKNEVKGLSSSSPIFREGTIEWQPDISLPLQPILDKDDTKIPCFKKKKKNVDGIQEELL